MSLREVIILLIVVTVASVMLGQLLGFAVSLVYPDIDPGDLQGRVALVLTCVAVLGIVWWFRLYRSSSDPFGISPGAHGPRL